MSARKVSSIISRMSHFAPFISSGRLHLRFLQFWFKQQWTQHQQSWDTPIQLDADFLSYLSWFLSPTVMTGVPLHLPDPSLFFVTDASLKGWGASWKDHQISGPWSPQDSQRHINWLELEAVCLALLRWGPQWRHQTVRVYCDNSTAVAYIRKQGGTHSQSLFRKTLELFKILDQFVITLIPTHLPGARNVTADALSRLSQPSPTEWRLPTETLNKLFYAFGTPLMDMFATAANKVTPVFVSPYPGDRAWAVDALSLSWDDLGLVYAFPPAPIVPKTLLKIQKSRGTTVIMIASQHPSRPWHPLLLQLSTRPSSDPSFRHPTVPVCAQHTATSIPPRSQAIGSSRVELIRDILKRHHFPDTVVDMAADPLRDSSSNVYNSQWKAFALWADNKGILPNDLSFITLAEYLVYLFSQNKKVNTILVHKASISSVLKLLKIRPRPFKKSAGWLYLGHGNKKSFVGGI